MYCSVTVINVISGEIKTNILKRDSNAKLPDGRDRGPVKIVAELLKLSLDSIFLPLRDEFRNHVQRTPSKRNE